MPEVITLDSHDYWVKVVGMLQQNWALITSRQNSEVCIHFIADSGSVFDALVFPTEEYAIAALRRNGFSRYADDAQLQSFICPPEPPFHKGSHPNGPIYSSGQYWRK